VPPNFDSDIAIHIAIGVCMSKVKRKIPTTTPRKKSKSADEEESILRAATIHLIRHVGGLFVATALRPDRDQESRRWIITVNLRYPNGYEGFVGDLLYDGDAFTMLTNQSVMDERVRQIEANSNGNSPLA
jgi:hypothetical protein